MKLYTVRKIQSWNKRTYETMLHRAQEFVQAKRPYRRRKQGSTNEFRSKQRNERETGNTDSNTYIWRHSRVKKNQLVLQEQIKLEYIRRHYLSHQKRCVFLLEPNKVWTNQIQNTMKTKIAVRCNELKINRAIMHNVSSMTMLPSNPTSNIPRHMISVVISRPASKYASI